MLKKVKFEAHEHYEIHTCVHFFFKTNYITKTEVLPKDERENCQAGEMARLNFNVKCVDNSVDQDQLLFYEIVCDSNNWAPAGKTSGKCEIILLIKKYKKLGVIGQILICCKHFVSYPNHSTL